MSDNPLVGVYTLDWQRVINPNGSQDYPRGKDAVGQLIYTAQGKMSVQLVRISNNTPHRTDFSTEETALRGTLAYAGSYTVNIDAQTVTHHLQTCTYAEWVGSNLVRHFGIEHTSDGARLLTLTAHYNGEQRSLQWRKVHLLVG